MNYQEGVFTNNLVMIFQGGWRRANID